MLNKWNNMILIIKLEWLYMSRFLEKFKDKISVMPK